MSNENTDILWGNWKKVSGEIKQKWGKLTDDDLKKIDGKKDKFLGMLAEKYGLDVKEAEKQLEEFYNKNRRTFENLKEEVTHRLGDFSEKISETVEETKDQAKNYYDKLEKYVKQCPIKAITVAAGIGALIGLILLR